MSEKNTKSINFLRKNVYYFLFIVALAIVSIITIALVVSNGNSEPSGGSNVIEAPDNNGGQNNGNENVDDNKNQNVDDNKNQNDKEEDNTQKPVVSVIVFDMPVNGTIIKDYVATSVVYNQTLGLYSGHKAIDFGAEEGTKVMAVYGGTIESIVTSKLEGVTLTLDHGNGLKSVYNSIEVNENLEVGASVNKGDELGVVSTNNRTEYKDGAHLHFEVLENGVKVDPYKYLLTEEK